MKNPQSIFFVTVLFAAENSDFILFMSTCVCYDLFSIFFFVTLFLKFDLLYFTHLMIQFLLLMVFWFFPSSFWLLLHDHMYIQVSLLSCLILIPITFSFCTVCFWPSFCASTAPSGYSELIYDIRNVKLSFPCTFLHFLSVSSGLLEDSQIGFCSSCWKIIWNARESPQG